MFIFLPFLFLCFRPVLGRRRGGGGEEEESNLTIDEIITRAFESQPGFSFSSSSSSSSSASSISSFEENADAHQDFIARVDPEEAAEGHSLRELDMMLTKEQQINLYRESVFYESFVNHPSREFDVGAERGYGKWKERTLGSRVEGCTVRTRSTVRT